MACGHSPTSWGPPVSPGVEWHAVCLSVSPCLALLVLAGRTRLCSSLGWGPERFPSFPLGNGTSPWVKHPYPWWIQQSGMYRSSFPIIRVHHAAIIRRTAC